MNRPLARQWDLFAAIVLPTDAGSVQRIETRRAFYAGAEAMRKVLLDAPEGDTAEMAHCDAIDSELREFAKALIEGKA